jgi:crossover junction endodeoxyribonuclease RuvC
MFVLGIDPGLTATGYGVVEVVGGVERAVAAGVVRTNRDLPTAERLVELAADLRDLVAEYRPATAAIEQVFVNRNTATAMSVGRASGVAILVLAEAGVAVGEYTPSGVKMALTGSGSADKQQMQRVVAMRLALPEPPQPADAADALAVALCHLQHLPLQRIVGSA